MTTKIERSITGQWNVLVNGQIVEGGFFSRAVAREAAARMKAEATTVTNGYAEQPEPEMMDTVRDEIAMAGGPDHDTRGHEGMEAEEPEPESANDVSQFETPKPEITFVEISQDTRPVDVLVETPSTPAASDAIVAPVAVVKSSFMLQSADGFLRRIQPSNGKPASYKVVGKDKAIVYRSREMAETKVAEAATLGVAAWVVEL